MIGIKAIMAMIFFKNNLNCGYSTGWGHYGGKKLMIMLVTRKLLLNDVDDDDSKTDDNGYIRWYDGNIDDADNDGISMMRTMMVMTIIIIVNGDVNRKEASDDVIHDNVNRDLMTIIVTMMLVMVIL